MSIKGKVVWDLSEWNRHLQRVSDAVEAATFESLDKMGDDGERLTKAYAPVDTGAMRDSVRKEGPFKEGDDVYVQIAVGGKEYINPKTGGPVDYPLHVEWGTSNTRAQPFLRPGITEASVNLVRYFNEAFRRAMR